MANQEIKHSLDSTPAKVNPPMIAGEQTLVLLVVGREQALNKASLLGTFGGVDFFSQLSIVQLSTTSINH